MASRAKQDGDAKRVQMVVRIAPQVRERLEEAARLSGRSLSQEVELSLAAHLAAADTRQIIREEIRAVFAERAEADKLMAALIGPVRAHDDLNAPLLGLPGPPLNG